MQFADRLLRRDAGPILPLAGYRIREGVAVQTMRQAVAALFSRHESRFNDGLAGTGGAAAVLADCDAAYVAATPAGISTGVKDDDLHDVASATIDRYRRAGVTRMTIVGLRTEIVDPHHAVAFVDWAAECDGAGVGGRPTTVDFAAAYLVRVERGRARLFGWITGDADAALQLAGRAGQAVLA